MAYVDVDTAFSSAKTPGDLKGRIEAAMVRRAVTRLPTVANGDDQRELAVCRAVLDGTFPDDWVRLTMSFARHRRAAHLTERPAARHADRHGVRSSQRQPLSGG
jgi:hypothetical protein